MDPYFVLKVPLSADDQVIRKAYLEGVKLASPDKDPEGFQAISGAYALIKDEALRRDHLLFSRIACGQSPMEALLQTAWMMPPPDPLPLESLKQYLRSCAKP